MVFSFATAHHPLVAHGSQSGKVSPQTTNWMNTILGARGRAHWREGQGLRELPWVSGHYSIAIGQAATSQPVHASWV